MQRRRRGSLLILLIVLLCVLTLIYFREQVLRQVGSFLVVQDPLEKADVIFVLGGYAPERGAHAARLYEERVADLIVTSGARVDSSLELFDMQYTDAELTAQALNRAGVPQDAIVVLNQGKSTMEEGFIARDYVARQGCKAAIVVTSPYHTRRAAWVMRRALKGTGVKVMMSPSGMDEWHPAEWWRHEEEMLFVNNEYLKFLYYLLHYSRGSEQDILAHIRSLGD